MSEVKAPSIFLNYMPSLDGLRALAVGIVMFGHFAGILKIPERLMSTHSFYRFLRDPGIGVDLFFVMSGFLITTILLEIRAGEGSMKSFWMRRVVRIAPLYLFYLVFMLLLPNFFDVAFLNLNSFSFLE